MVPPVTGTTDPLSITTTHANTMVIGSFRMNSTSTPTQGTGYTIISGANFLLSEYQIFSSTQSGLSVTIGTGAGDANGCIADALVAAASVSGIAVWPYRM